MLKKTPQSSHPPRRTPSPLLPQLLPRHKQAVAMAGPSFPTDKHGGVGGMLHVGELVPAG